MQYVFVLDKNKQPLDLCHPARARQLLREGRATVFRRYPFTIRLKDRELEESVTHAHQVKLDPGSRTTGIALVRAGNNKVLWAVELAHRGLVIKAALDDRRGVRRGRRSRKCRFRPPRFDNRRRGEGWLPPSLESRVVNIQTWVRRLRWSAPVESISMELVKFDTQALQNPDISGVEYQQGELMGYEIREYLLEKWGRKCAYCGRTGMPLQVEHIVPKSRGGSKRVSNLTLSCQACNLEKGSRTAEEFDHPEIQAEARQPLKDAAAVNTTRWELWRRLSESGLPVHCGTGGRTKFNRTRFDLPKAHWIDAACVGAKSRSFTR
jgi:5-methylcytosine-specific restriction endonuclease McrA